MFKKYKFTNMLHKNYTCIIISFILLNTSKLDKYIYQNMFLNSMYFYINQFLQQNDLIRVSLFI